MMNGTISSGMIPTWWNRGSRCPLSFWIVYELQTLFSKSLEGSTPFSCCSMSSIFPCIHHGIEATGSIYLYRPETNLSISTHGCFAIVKQKRQIVGWKIIGKLIQLVILMVEVIFLKLCLFDVDWFQLLVCCGVRLLQTAHYDKFRYVGHSGTYTMWLFGCYVGKKRETSPSPLRSEEFPDEWKYSFSVILFSIKKKNLSVNDA